MADTVEVVVAVVGRAHGVRGEVNLTLRTDEPDRRFEPGRTLLVEGLDRVLTVTSKHWSAGHLQVVFAEVGDRNDAEALRGAILLARVLRDEEPEQDDEFYDRELVGLAVLDSRGHQVGTVGEVLHLPAQDVLSVSTGTGERLVPFVCALVPQVDTVAGTVRLADVPGLVDDLAVDDGGDGAR